MGIEQSLSEYGFYASTVEGVSMVPMLCPRRDTVFIKAVEGEVSPLDVALYHVPGGKYVLHRVLKEENGYYVICGDNCVDLEYIPREYVIGKLLSFYKDEKQVELTDWRYRLYALLWCRPWHLRIILLKGRRILGKVWRSLHGNK